MGKYYFTEGFSLEVGPQIGFLLKAEGEVDGISVDFKDEVKNIDFGLNFGVGYKMKNGLNFGVRYNLGLSNTNDMEGIDDKNQNIVFQISIGYFFLRFKWDFKGRQICLLFLWLKFNTFTV